MDVTTILTGLSPLGTMAQDVFVQAVVPLFGTLILLGVTWATAQAAKLLGEKNAAAWKVKIIEALTNSLQRTAGVNTPGNPTFTQAVGAAVDYAKVAYPDAIKKLGAKDGPLETMATAMLNELIAQGLAKVAQTSAR